MNVRVRTILFLFFIILADRGITQQQVTLRLKWWHQFQFAGYYAALTQGYYANKGLTVTIVPGDAAHSIIQEVLSGNADFGITGSDLLIEFARGRPLVALGALFQHSPYVIMSLSDRHIHSPSDLIGKNIMASENQGWVELKAIFLKEGIDTKNMHVLPHTWNNLDLVKGYADAMTGYRSVEPFQLQQLGVTPTYITPVTYGIDFYGDLLFATRSFVDHHPQTVEDFRQASFKGWEYAMAHKEAMCDYILSLPGVKERKVSRAQLMFEANEMEKLILPQLVEIGHMNEGRWSHILAIHQELGLIPRNTKLDQFLYEKKPSISASLKNIGTLVLASVAGLFLVILIYVIIIRRAVKRKTQEQRKSLEALSSSEEKYRALIEQASDGILIWNTDLYFIQANSAMLQLLGYSKADFYHLRLPDILVVSENEPALRFDELQYGQSLFSEQTVRRKDGSRFIVEIHSNRLSDGNYLGFVRDITERKSQETEKEKRAIEREMLIHELSNTNKELKQFSFITSHNLRAPLTNLIAITSLIDLNKVQDKETRELIQGFTTSTQQLNETLNDLVKILIIKESPNLSIDTISFEQVFQQVRRSINSIIENAHTVIRTDFSASREIAYNRLYMESIFMNLITNSIKYAHPGRSPQIDIYTEIKDEQVQLVFKDNGSGFDMAKVKDRIFGLHQRFHNHPDSKGIGLYLIHSQIVSLGGSIGAYSEVGTGTVFTIRFKKNL